LRGWRKKNDKQRGFIGEQIRGVCVSIVHLLAINLLSQTAISQLKERAFFLMRCFRPNGGWRKADHALLTIELRSIRPSITALSRSRRVNLPRRELLHTTRPTTTTIYPASQTLPVANTTPRRAAKPSRQTTLVPRRYCSHRRNMCRHFGGEEHGSATIAGAREVLPTNVKPMHYDLTLEPNFEDFTYEGKVVIEYVRTNVQEPKVLT
jgi:hypothetical protein